MSDLLTMEDFEGKKQSLHNKCRFGMLIEVAKVALEKYDPDDKNYQNIESNLGGNNDVVKKKMNSLRFVIKRQHNEEKNLTSYVIKSPQKIHDNNIVKTKANHQNLRKAKRGQHVRDFGIDQSSREVVAPKRKLAETMSNEEWIKAIETKRKNNNERGSQNPPSPPPPQPSLAKEFETEIINKYRGTRIIRVIQKSLSSTDVSKGHNRVSIPCSQVESFKFLDNGEMTDLRNQQSITVPLIHKPISNGVAPALTQTSMEFRQWNMRKDKNDIQKVSYMYVLRTKWNKIVSMDELKRGDTIQIWAFRDGNNNLCMALVKL